LIAEEWFDGSLHSYSTIIKDQKIIFEYFDSEFCLYHDFLVSTSISSAPTDNQVRQGLANEVSRLIKELQLVDGVLHCQYLLGDSGYRILEFTRRMSGDLYSTVVQGVRGIRHSDVFIGSSIGAQVTDYLTPVQSQSPFISRHCITAQGTGQFSGLSIDPGLRPNLVSLTLARPLGSALNSDGLGKAAVAILSFESEAEMRRFALTCKDSMRCEINP